MPTQPAADSERHEVVDDLIDALRLFTVESDVFVDVFARTHGLGRNDLDAIMWISQGTRGGHPITAGELASRLGLGAPATTGLVDRLEQAGHVRRERDPHDRRKVTIVMQPRALQLATDFFVPLGRLMHETVAGISPSDLQRVTAVVRLLTTGHQRSHRRGGILIETPRRPGMPAALRTSTFPATGCGRSARRRRHAARR